MLFIYFVWDAVFVSICHVGAVEDDIPLNKTIWLWLHDPVHYSLYQIFLQSTVYETGHRSNGPGKVWTRESIFVEKKKWKKFQEFCDSALVPLGLDRKTEKLLYGSDFTKFENTAKIIINKKCFIKSAKFAKMSLKLPRPN